MIRVIRNHAPAGFLPLLVTELLVALGCFYAAGMLLMAPDPWMYFVYAGGLERVLLALATLLVALYFFDLYKHVAVTSRVELAQRLCQAVGLMLLAQSVISYAKGDWIVPHWLMLYASAFVLVALYLWRLIYSAAVLRAVGRERVLFAGENLTVHEVLREMRRDPAGGCEVIGVLGGAEGASLGPISALREVAARYKPHRIVVGLPERRGVMPVADLLDLRFAGSRIEEAGQAYETVFRRVSLREVHPKRAVFAQEFSPPGNSLALTDLGSRVIAALFILLLWPFMLLIFLALTLTSREPAIVRTECCGLDARRFRLVRFRGAPGLGFLYRNLHLDALPELFNVLRGDMAIVGPRPDPAERAIRLARENLLYEFRQNARPGMTGWAQINLMGREVEDPLLALEYDLFYIKNMSQSLNTYILLATLKNRVFRWS